MSVKLIETIEPNTWDVKVMHPLQSYAWGEFREKTGVPIVRFGVYDTNGNLELPFLMTIHPIPHTNYFVGYIPRSIPPTDEVVTFLHTYAKSKNIIAVKWEPEVLFSEKAMLPKVLRPALHATFFSWTSRIDVRPTIQALEEKLSKKTRYNIRLAERKGVVVREVFGDEAFAIFSKLFFATTERKKFGGHTEKYHKLLWETLAPRGIAHMFVGYVGDEPIAVYEVFLWKGGLYTPYSASSEKYREYKVKNLVLWRILCFGKEQGCTFADLWGIETPSKNGKTKWAGFSEFKRGYGGLDVAYMGSFYQSISPLIFFVFSTIESILALFRRLKR